jgi:hypothetical protein
MCHLGYFLKTPATFLQEINSPKMATFWGATIFLHSHLNKQFQSKIIMGILRVQRWLVIYVFWFMRVLDRGPGQRESKLTVLCPLIIIIFISYIIIFYIIIKLLIMENHPSQNRKWNSVIDFLDLLSFDVDILAHYV